MILKRVAAFGQAVLLACALWPASVPAVPGLEAAARRAARLQSATTGTYSALVIFARFAGEAPDETSKPPWADDLFDAGVPGSFTHFYNEMSGGRLHVGGQVLPRRYASREPASAYLAAHTGARGDFGRFNLEILAQADADADFGQFDNDGPDGVPNSGDDDGYVDILFINLLTVPRDFLISGATGLASLGLQTDYLSNDPAAGGGVVRVRSEYSGFGGTTQRGHTFTVTAATMCHEFGHVLGLPDLFDQSSVTAGGELDPVEDSAGIGKWGLMGLGTLGWGVEDGPNAFSAWSLARLGWLAGRIDVITGTRLGIELAPIDRGGHVLKIPVTEDEYFLVENRQRGDSYYNRNIPGGGLLVWHVDERADNDEEHHKRVDLVCADGLFADAGYPGTRPDPINGGDNLDFWARDDSYAAAHHGNQGDATDPFDGVRARRLAWDTNPGARAHAGPRRGVPLGFALEEITPLGDGVMGLDVHVHDPVEGNIGGDVTWSGRVDVDGDVVVEPGARLTLAAGTQVRFASADRRRSGYDTTRCELIVYGDLVVEGTAASPVVLAGTGSSGDWLGVLLPGGAATGLDAALASGGLLLQRARLGVARGRLPSGPTRWTGALQIPWDMVVPAGAELTVDAGTRVLFAPQDLGFRGDLPGAVELVVEGSLVVRGQSIRPVVFDVDSADPQALWGGVRLAEGASVDAEGLTITQALAGIDGSVAAPGAFRLSGGQLYRLGGGLRLTLFRDALVEDSLMRTITINAIDARGFGTLEVRGTRIEGNGNEGVSVRNAGLRLVDTEIVGNGILDSADPRSGLVARGGRGQRLEIRGGRVEGNTLHGVLADEWEGLLRLDGVTVSGNDADGVRAAGAAQVVLDGAQVLGNGAGGARLQGVSAQVSAVTFRDNAAGGLVVDGGRLELTDSRFVRNGLLLTDVAEGTVHTSTFDSSAVALTTTRSAPSVRANRFAANTTALRVAGAPVPAPLRGNTFVDNELALDNRGEVVVDARQNYWGTTDSSAIAGLVQGPALWSPWLDDEPPLTVVTGTAATTPSAVVLHAAWPNPFNGATVIAFDLPTPAVVDLTVYDVLGQPVRRLRAGERLAPGSYRVAWRGRDDGGRAVASGLYLYRLRTDRGDLAGGRVVLVR